VEVATALDFLLSVEGTDDFLRLREPIGCALIGFRGTVFNIDCEDKFPSASERFCLVAMEGDFLDVSREKGFKKGLLLVLLLFADDF